MIRTFLWALAGVGLGIVIHLVVILTMPTLAETNVWARVSSLNSLEKITVLDDLTAQSANELQLDPELLYGVCQLDLSKGVGVVTARLPDSFWSVAIFDILGRPVYGTTNRASFGHVLQLGIFNVEQTKLLASQQLDIAEGLLIVEAEMDELFIVFRLAPPHQVMRARYRDTMGKIICKTS